MTEQSKDKPKIIVDDDWKSQAQAEKAELQQQAEAKQAESQSKPADDAQAMQLPPASFPFLITTLATQAMTALGQGPDPSESKPVVRLELAKHHIDTLGVLQEKTKGNLDKEEASMLDDVLHQLRMLFVAIQNQPAEPSSEKKSELEL